MTQKLRLGGDTPSKLYLGADLVQRAYLGADLVWQAGYPPATMVLTMATTGPSAEERTVRIPFAAASLNVDIDWGDGTTTNHTAANPERVYAAEGTYTILVTGAARTLGNATVSARWSTKLRSVIQWGDLGLTSLANAFRSYTGASLPLPSDLPSGVTTLTLTFYQAANLTSLPDLATWDTTNVAIMSSTFNGCSGLTSPPPVGSWSTANVTTLLSTFQNCSGITAPPDVSGWNTAKVQSMAQAFRNMGSQDIPCDDWSIAGVTTPSSFDQMFLGTTLPTARYDALLTKWEAQATKPTGANFHGGSSKYTAAPSAAATARASLADPATNNWTIADGGT